MIDPRIDEMREYLSMNLSEKRYYHSLCVADAARRLAEINGADSDKCYLAGLLHDICKELPKDVQLDLVLRSGYDVSEIELNAPKTHHAVAGAQFIKEKYGIDDPDILTPVRWHTLGYADMTLYEQIIFMADLISDDRDYKDAEEIRAITYADLDRGLYEAFKFLMKDYVKKQRIIPQSTLDAYNKYTRIELKRLADTE